MLAEKSPCKLPRFFPQWYLSRNHSKCTDDLRGPVDVENLDLSFVPRGRLKALARYATTAQIYNLRQLARDHRLATSLAFAHAYLAEAYRQTAAHLPTNIALQIEGFAHVVAILAPIVSRSVQRSFEENRN